MKRALLGSMAAVLLTVGTLTVMAQERPAPPEGQGPPPADDRGPGGPGGPGMDDRKGPGGRGDDRGPGGDDRGPKRGPGGPGGPGGAMQGGPSGSNDVARFQNYLAVVEQYGKLAANRDATAVAAVVSASDVLRRTGPQAGIDYFTKLLPEVKLESVKRAIRLQLVDMYKANKQDDKALEVLKVLILDDGSESKKE